MDICFIYELYCYYHDLLFSLFMSSKFVCVFVCVCVFGISYHVCVLSILFFLML